MFERYVNLSLLKQWFAAEQGRSYSQALESKLAKVTTLQAGAVGLRLGAYQQRDARPPSVGPGSWIGAELESSGGFSGDLQFDVGDLPFESGSIDRLVLDHLLEHIADIDSLLQGVNEIVSLDGKVIVCGLLPQVRLARCPINWRRKSGNRRYRRFFPVQILAALSALGFESQNTRLITVGRQCDHSGEGLLNYLPAPVHRLSSRLRATGYLIVARKRGLNLQIDSSSGRKLRLSDAPASVSVARGAAGEY